MQIEYVNAPLWFVEPASQPLHGTGASSSAPQHHHLHCHNKRANYTNLWYIHLLLFALRPWFYGVPREQVTHSLTYSTLPLSLHRRILFPFPTTTRRIRHFINSAENAHRQLTRTGDGAIKENRPINCH